MLAVLLDAASSERNEPADFVVRPGGSVDYASTSGTAWLALGDFRSELARAIRALDASAASGIAPPRSIVLERACASWVRLDGAGGHASHRYLVDVRAPTAPGQHEPGLTVTQGRVAEYLVAGAKAREVATACI